jgi:hypothetical protein
MGPSPTLICGRLRGGENVQPDLRLVKDMDDHRPDEAQSLPRACLSQADQISPTQDNWQSLSLRLVHYERLVFQQEKASPEWALVLQNHTSQSLEASSEGSQHPLRSGEERRLGMMRRLT